jgi:hypothetical protein
MRPDDRSSMHHMVLTKYNVAFTDRFTDSDRNVSSAWLETRLQLFINGPLRSMRAQERRPNQWLLFLDARTPTRELELLGDTVGDDAELVPITGRVTDTQIAIEVRKRMPPWTRRLVTTRLDSDDALGIRMLRAVQELAPFHEGFLNPACGLQMVGETVLLRYDSSGAFMSFVELVKPSLPVNTVFRVEHYRARSVAPVRRLPGIHYVQVIHGGNFANELDGVPVPRQWAWGRVGFDPVPCPPPTPHPGIALLAKAAAHMVVRELGGLVNGR